MADIDQILAGGAGASTRVDFSSLGGLADAFFDTSKKRAEFDTRRAFRDGVPLDESGQPDFGAISKTFFQKGDYQQGIAAANLDLQRQQLKFGQQQSTGINTFEQGGAAPPQPQSPLVSPPSPNRSASTPVAPPLNKGGVQQQPQGPAGSPQGDRPGSIVGLVSGMGIPDELAGPIIGQVSAMARIDPNAPVPPEMLPRIQAVVRAAIQRMKGGDQPTVPQGVAPAQQVMGPGGPQVAQNGPGGVMPPPQPLPQGAAPPAPPGQPSPVTSALTTPNAPGPSRAQQAIAYYSGIMSNPMSPKSNIDLAKTRLEALQKDANLTPDEKNYAHAVSQGFTGTMQDLATKTEADKTYASENVKSYVKKYDAIQANGDRARVDIPQLDLARKLTEDPNFYSGVGEKYNLLVKRALVALGGDANTAAPQEAFRKIVSNSILDQIKAMAGTGQIRVAEIKIMQDAAANPDNTPQSNRLLLELSSRLQKRAAVIADMAQNYNNGRLDSGFDRKVADYDRRNPMISSDEIPNFRAIIDKGAKAPGAPTQKFATPSDVHAAIAAGKLKSGDAFTDANGKTRYVP